MFNKKINVSVTVTNTGKVAGKEIVQLYLSAPAKSLDKPAEELKGFAKTKLLQPGESQTLSLVVDERDLASYDTQRESWVAEAGTYTVLIGKSSENIAQKGTFTVAKEIVVEKDHKVLSPQIEINELKPQ